MDLKTDTLMNIILTKYPMVIMFRIFFIQFSNLSGKQQGIFEMKSSENHDSSGKKT